MPQIGTESKLRAIWQCRRCGHRWVPRPQTGVPKQCPSCHCQWP